MTNEPLAAQPDIRRFARGAISAAGVADVLPIPVSEIAAAVGLHADDLFALGADAPPGVLEIIRKLRGKVLGLLSIPERRYHVDRTMPVERQRFTEAHEIGHDALPWHQAAYFGEDSTTLSPDTNAVLESEANAFASELLFGAGRFNREADQWAPALDVPLNLAPAYQTSVHATLRRYVEWSERPLALIGMGRIWKSGGLTVFPNQTMESAGFFERYGPLLPMLPKTVTAATYPPVSRFATVHPGQVEECEVVLDTKRGRTPFIAEGFGNGYLNFVLLYRRRRLDGPKLQIADSPLLFQ
jgi:hypothetical protein